jgi:hypothetical protein
MSAVQLPLIHWPIAGVEPIDIAEANRLLFNWKHKLGPVNRPFRMEPFVFLVDGRPLGVVVTASVVSTTVAGYRRAEVVELARQCAAPGSEWVNRVLLRLWRELLAPRWACWPVRAAVSYSKNAMHKGDLYRFDGWEKISDNCGSSGGGSWSKARNDDDALKGSKTLWLWRYPESNGEAA